MSDETETVERPRYPGNPNSSPGLWLALGTLLGFFGAMMAVGGNVGVAVVGTILASVGGALFLIGAVAKGVEVGIRNARD